MLINSSRKKFDHLDSEITPEKQQPQPQTERPESAVHSLTKTIDPTIVVRDMRQCHGKRRVKTMVATSPNLMTTCIVNKENQVNS